MSERNYYDVLGISPGADGTTVNRAYWQLARKYQGLETSDPRSHNLLDELNEAYNTLGTPTLRETYDADVSHFASAPEPQAADDIKKKRRKQRAAHAMQSPSGDELTNGFAVPAWAPYAGGLLIGAASIGIGALTGSLLIPVLGVLAASALGLVAARGRLLQSWRTHSERSGPAKPVPSETTEAPQKAPRRTTSAPSVRQPAMKADDLRTSTASMVSRWRTSTAGVAEFEDSQRMPDSTLMDIFGSERDMETQAEPLSAVLDVLRGSRKSVETR